MRILYNSTEVSKAVQQVLGDPLPGDRRVILVAYIGVQAQAFLPHPEGLEIVCCLQPGATDAVTLDRLRRRGAKIHKSERLHMKVYWSSRQGCVICSANASNNALGSGGQKEAGAFFPIGVVDVERLLAYAQPEAIKFRDLKRLTSLSDLIPRPTSSPADSLLPDFQEWQSMSTWRNWKIGPWWIDGEFAENAVQEAADTYGVSKPHNFIDVKHGRVKKGDWILTFRTPAVVSIRWLFVHFVTKVRSLDKRAYDKDYPFQAVQAVPLRLCHQPPFRIDGAFQSAFKKAVKQFGVESLEEPSPIQPPAGLLQLIGENLSLKNRS